MIGQIVHDYALGKNGFVVSGAWVEIQEALDGNTSRELSWEWLVLYEDGELMGGDTNDLKVVENESR